MRRILQFFCLILVTSSCIWSQSIKIIYSPDSIIKFLPAHSEPPSNWYSKDFDDSSWESDTAVISYGEPSYYEIDPRPNSIYYRFRFNVKNKSNIDFLNFIADYDDGYIAYLNGKEIARVNVDPAIKYPAYNDLAIRSHESELFSGSRYPILGVYLDTALLDSCLLEGENVMSVHVLNDSVNGSDIAFIPYIINNNKAQFDAWNFYQRYKRLTTIDSTRLPLVIINTDEYGIRFRGEGAADIRFIAHMDIIDNGTESYNSPSDPANVFSGSIGMELRGKSSSYFPKQSYRIELENFEGQDTSFALLGMPEESDWILFGPFADRSQIRNKLVYDLGAKLGSYQPRSKFCELILNGKPVGLYALTENIKRDNDRVNISKLKTTDITGVDVTGGYILKYDKNQVGDVIIPGERRIVYPRKEDLQPEQKAYITRYFQIYDSIMYNNVFFDPINGFRKIASDSSLIDYVIMNELSKNCDAYSLSTYFYKDREDKDNRVKFGPLWDYDLSFGNTWFQEGNVTTGWQFSLGSNPRFLIKRVFQDTSMVHMFQRRWKYLRTDILSDESIFNVIDSMVGQIHDQVKRNYYIWPIEDKIPWANAGQYPVSSYEDEINKLKAYISARAHWIDENIDAIYYPKVILSGIEENLSFFSCSFYPNPFSDKLVLEINSDNGGDIKVEFFNLVGQKEFEKSENVGEGYAIVNIESSQLSDLKNGLYIVRIFKDNILVNTQKIIKEK